MKQQHSFEMMLQFVQRTISLSFSRLLLPFAVYLIVDQLPLEMIPSRALQLFQLLVFWLFWGYFCFCFLKVFFKN